MNSQNFTLAENLIPSSYVQQAASALRTRENLAKTLMEQVRFHIIFLIYLFSSNQNFIFQCFKKYGSILVDGSLQLSEKNKYFLSITVL